MMKQVKHEQTLAQTVLHLLDVILRGMRERSEILDSLERRIDGLTDQHVEETRWFIAQTSRCRHDLHTARRELARLGCALMSASNEGDSVAAA